MVENHTEHRDLRMGVGDRQQLGGYEVRMTELSVLRGPNYVADQATFEIYRGDRLYKTVSPQKRRYNASGMVMTEASIDSGFTRDLYIAMGEPLDGGDWAVRLSVKPYVDWIWAGAFYGSSVDLCQSPTSVIVNAQWKNNPNQVLRVQRHEPLGCLVATLQFLLYWWAFFQGIDARSKCTTFGVNWKACASFQLTDLHTGQVLTSQPCQPNRFYSMFGRVVYYLSSEHPYLTELSKNYLSLV